MNIKFDENTLLQSSKGKITSVIYFQFGEFCFPEMNWSDFTVVILSWWNKAIDDFALNSEFLFMDGDFFVEISVLSESEVLFRCYENNTLSFETELDFIELKSEIKNISQKVLICCDEKQIKSDDVDILRSLLK